jgi:hypothetical protein
LTTLKRNKKSTADLPWPLLLDMLVEISSQIASSTLNIHPSHQHRLKHTIITPILLLTINPAVLDGSVQNIILWVMNVP